MPRLKNHFRINRGDGRFKKNKQRARTRTSIGQATASDKFEAWKSDIPSDVLDALHETQNGEIARNNGIAPRLKDYIVSLGLEDVKVMIQAHMGISNPNPVMTATLIHQGLKIMLGDNRDPREEQVAVLFKLLFEGRDVILVAKTGFGKSLIFQAYSILSGYMTIQLTPLSKLGEEQRDSLNRTLGVKACLVNSETKYTDPSLLNRIEELEYTHVILSPELLLSSEFHKILSKPDFGSKLGLIAIDECHLIRQWDNFREQFAQISSTRQILPRRVVYFGCTATLDSESEKYVLKNGGFRHLSHEPGHLQIIRTSVDRPDITISVVPIPRRGLRDYSPLLFLLSPLKHDRHCKSIPKTIIFVDGQTLIHVVANVLRSELKSMGYSRDCMGTVIREFSSEISEHDKDVVFETFKDPESTTRIVVATNALGMGMDIPGVEIVVQWNLPVKPATLADLWQRIGRAARGKNHTGKAYVYLPYWLFNNLGFVKQRQERQGHHQLRNAVLSQSVDNRRRTQRNMLSNDRRASQTNSPLSQEWPAVDQDYASDSSVGSQADMDSHDIDDTRHHDRVAPKAWTQADLESRRSISESWLQFVNSECHRRAILHYLQQSEPDCNDGSLCCSACDRSLLPPAYEAVGGKEVPEKPPAAGTRAAIALNKLCEWAEDQGEFLDLLGEEPLSVVPSHLFLPTLFQWRLVRPFNDRRFDKSALLPYRSRDELAEAIKPGCWEYIDQWAEPLICFLNSIREATADEYELEKERKRSDRAAQS